LDAITSDEAIDMQVESKISEFVNSLHEDRFDKAETTFDDVIASFSMRAKIEESRKKLNKRINRFSENYNINNTKAYRKFQESLPLFEKFLKENQEELKNNKKLVEGLRLSKVVGETYDLPKVELADLHEQFMVIPANSKKTLYEMVCEKELVRKELLEAKESFSNMWAKNDRITSLASHIYSNDGTIKESLRAAVADVPYLALSNKVDLTTVMESVFQVTNPGNISKKDIREFVNKIYEFKKPLKSLVVETLNGMYGVNVQSLRFIPSFKGLAEVQAQVLDMVSESAGEGILADVLKEFSTCLSRKGGVQVLDVANVLSETMAAADFEVVEINESFDMKKLSDYLSHNLDEAQYYGDDDAMSNSGGNAKTDKKKKSKKDKDFGGNKGDIKAADRKKDDDSKLKADEKGDVDYNKNDLPGDQDKLDQDKDGDIDAKDLKKLRDKKKKKVNEELGNGQVGHDSEAEAAEAEEEEHAEDVAQGSADKDFRELVDTIEDVVSDMDLNLEDEAEEEEESEESVEDTDDAAAEKETSEE
jgi:hypothetical protein